jgi:HAMP domain-containing protein
MTTGFPIRVLAILVALVSASAINRRLLEDIDRWSVVRNAFAASDFEKSLNQQILVTAPLRTHLTPRSVELSNKPFRMEYFLRPN